jgi:hypothetical protein
MTTRILAATDFSDNAEAALGAAAQAARTRICAPCRARIRGETLGKRSRAG